MAKNKILIADDEPNIVTSLEFLMQSNGYETIVARNGHEAITQVIKYQPELILLDVMLPLKNGFDVCEEIRANEKWNGIKIVFLTAKGRDAEIAKGLSLGADLYITKPFSTQELVAHVKRLLEDAEPTSK